MLIDGDLQDPPEVIPKMVARWREGFDVVYGCRTERAGESTFKLATARIFYRLLNKLSDVPIPLDTGDFRLMSSTGSRHTESDARTGSVCTRHG